MNKTHRILASVSGGVALFLAITVVLLHWRYDIAWLVAYLFMINVVAFVAFIVDKTAQKLEKRRVPEKGLLTLAILGGTIGAFLGMAMLRHKIAKKSFFITLWLIVALQIALWFIWITTTS